LVKKVKKYESEILAQRKKEEEEMLKAKVNLGK